MGTIRPIRTPSTPSPRTRSGRRLEIRLGVWKTGTSFGFPCGCDKNPSNPIIAAPAIEPIVKLEFWTEALSGNADFSLGAPPNFNPRFGDRVYDTDQNGPVPFATYVDSNNDGLRNDVNPPSVSLTTAGWTLVSTEYTVDDSLWGYQPMSDPFIPKTVADIEEVRPVLFTGDFLRAPL